ncbi:MAG: hypothetical protein Q7S68_05445 [Deltaproteobacteria bacterium]|nr:hypothetical protein [Deltaproteobacteria bacterium]
MNILLTIFLFLALLGVAGFFWIRERRYLKKKTSEVMSEQIWKDVIDEREEALEKRRRFHEALEKAKKREESRS